MAKAKDLDIRIRAKLDFRRAPRDWRKWWWGYVGHAVQGYIVMALTGLIGAWLLGVGFFVYQIMEYHRFRDVRQAKLAGLPPIDDWPSRDISDWLFGAMLGVFPGVAWQIAAIVLLT